MRIPLKSATALALAVLVSIGAATTSQAAEVTPRGGATGCCRTALQLRTGNRGALDQCGGVRGFVPATTPSSREMVDRV